MKGVKMINSGVKSIEFRFMSPKMIKDMSAVKIEQPELYDPDGYPIDGGLADLHLGVVDPGLRCKTCGGRAKECPGHFGHIELVRPVVHVEFGKHIYAILKATCPACKKLVADKPAAIVAAVEKEVEEEVTVAPKTVELKEGAIGDVEHAAAEVKAEHMPKVKKPKKE